MKRSPGDGASMPLRLAATFFLIGEAAPFAPATFASFALLPFLYPYALWPHWVQIVLTVAVTAFAVLASGRAEPYYGHDAKAITIDEVAGMLVTFLAVPLEGDLSRRIGILLVGFLLFRIMDVVKPFPANRSQNLPGGVGVVADDFLAGIYANLVLQFLVRLL